MSERRKLDLLAVGHALVDIRFLVKEFAGPDEEASVIKQSRGAGGSAVNVAIDASRLGLKTGVIAKIGFDAMGRLIVDELMREKVDLSGIRIGFGETGFTIVIINSRGEISMYGYKGVAEELEPSEINPHLISMAKHLHIPSLRIDTSVEAASIARKNNLTISWDPGRVLAKKGIDKLSEIIGLVDIVLANRHETKLMTGLDDYRKAAAEIKELGPRIVVVKKGGEGVYVLSSDLEKEYSAYKVDEVVDTTGAGDAFAAGLIAGLVKGYSLEKSIKYALAVAALKVTRLGSHEAPCHDEVVKFIWEREEEF